GVAANLVGVNLVPRDRQDGGHDEQASKGFDVELASHESSLEEEGKDVAGIGHWALGIGGESIYYRRRKDTNSSRFPAAARSDSDQAGKTADTGRRSERAEGGSDRPRRNSSTSPSPTQAGKTRDNSC